MSDSYKTIVKNVDLKADKNRLSLIFDLENFGVKDFQVVYKSFLHLKFEY